MNRFLSFLVIATIFCACQQQESTPVESSSPKGELAFKNPADRSIAYHGVTFPVPKEGADFLLRDGNQFIPYQLDDLDQDGQNETVFTQLNFAGNEVKQLEVKPGKRTEIPNKTQVLLSTGEGGIVWENEQIAYRLDLQSGFRYEVLGKASNQLRLSDSASGEKNPLPLIWEATNTLGLGSPGFLLSKSNYPEIGRDSLATFDQYADKRVEIIASGPLRSIFRVHLQGVRIGQDTLDLQIDHEMHAGHRWTDVRITILKTTNENLTFGTGLAKHSEAPNFVTGQSDDVFWGYTFGEQSKNGQKLGLALLAPISQKVRRIQGGFGENYIILMQPVNGTIHYRFLAAWDREPNGLVAAPLLLRYIRQVTAAM